LAGLPVFVLVAVFDDALLFELRGGLRLRVAFEFVVFGRELRNAPRTSSSGSCALTIRRPQVKATIANNMIRLFDFIWGSSE
jgi:hypothetical protein